MLVSEFKGCLIAMSSKSNICRSFLSIYSNLILETLFQKVYIFDRRTNEVNSLETLKVSRLVTVGSNGCCYNRLNRRVMDWW